MQHWQWGKSELREMLPVRELLSMLAGRLKPSFVEDLETGNGGGGNGKQGDPKTGVTE